MSGRARLGFHAGGWLASTILLFASPAAAQTFPPLPPVPVPPENPITEEKRILGKLLFWEEQLSSDNTMACGTCHKPADGMADVRVGAHPGLDGLFGGEDDVFGSLGVVSADSNGTVLPDPLFGTDRQVTRRIAPGFVGNQYAPELFLDGAAGGEFVGPLSGVVEIASGGALESQVLRPPLSDVEMAFQDRTWARIIEKLGSVRPLALATDHPTDVADVLAGAPSYPSLFADAFGDSVITPTRIAFAIATYERTLIPDETPWDAFNDGDTTALTPQQRDGFDAFRLTGCAGCHNPPLFTNNQFRNIGLRPVAEDAGRQEVTGLAGDRGKFKTPSLRGVGLRQRLMHNGRIESVDDAVQFYRLEDGHQHFTDNQDALVFGGMNIPDTLVTPLVDFLENGLLDPRLVSESFPFDRPTLLGELDTAAFADSTTGPTAVAWPTEGVAFVDYDSDGDLDIYALSSGPGETNALLRNDGDNTFVSFPAAGVNVTGAAIAQAWGDYDEDGDLDLYVAFDGSANRLFRNNGNGTLADFTTGPLADAGSGRSVSWVDVDLDGDLDLYLVNEGTANVLYRNEGDGSFANVTSGPEGDTGPSVSAPFGDYDGDGDLDVYLVQGTSPNVLLRNDGGAFVDVTSSPVGGPANATAAGWGDYDNDGDLDLYVTADGSNALYRNEGGGLFADVTAGPLGDGATGASVAWLDADADGDLDLYLSNATANVLLQNDGGGSFSNITTGPAGAAVDDSRGLAAGDVDADGDLDLYVGNAAANRLLHNTTDLGNHWLHLALTGVASNRSAVGARARIVTAAGSQIREVVTGTGRGSQDALALAFGTGAATTVDSVLVRWPSGAVSIRTAVAADQVLGLVEPLDLAVSIDADTTLAAVGDAVTFRVVVANLDPVAAANGVVVSHPVSAGLAFESATATSGVYTAGTGEWAVGTVEPARADTLTLTASTEAVTTAADVTQTALLTALDEEDWNAANDTASVAATVLPFSDAAAPLAALTLSAAAWGDHDADGDLDVLLAGQSASGPAAHLYRNDGGAFIELAAAIEGVSFASVAWGDADGDGDLEALVTGMAAGGRQARVYRNDAGAFTDTGAGLEGVDVGSGAWGDYDGDGDLDVLLTGRTDADRLARVYRNDGGAFADAGAGLEPVELSEGIWLDVDGDGDLDILLAGTSTGGPVTRLYRNDAGTFTDTGAALEAVTLPALAAGDYDGDGDLDVLLAGASAGGETARLYRNDGGTLVDAGVGLEGVEAASGGFGDYDADGDLDVLLAGSSASGPLTRIYANEAGAFTPIGAGTEGLFAGAAAWGDADGDGDLDVLVSGQNAATDRVSHLYLNDGGTVNAAPGAPAALTATVSGGEVMLTWGAAGDAETPAGGLSYNLRAGTTPGGGELVAPMAETASGFRHLPAVGNVGQRLERTLALDLVLEVETIYWSVQAVDGAFAGSPFAAEQTFAMAPLVQSIEDVANDQGRQVRVQWDRSPLDAEGAGGPVVTEYGLWRRVDALARAAAVPLTRADVSKEAGAPPPLRLFGGETWDFVLTVPARGDADYSVVAPTLCDSTDAGTCWSAFFVSAMTDDPLTFFDSAPDSGYSIDNLAPGAPVNLVFGAPDVLAWDEAPEPDFDFHTVYGSDNVVFDPEDALIGHTSVPTLDVTASPFDFYHVTTTDFAGNEGAAATIADDDVVGVPGETPTPTAFALHVPRPNPFGVTTAIGFDVPRASEVRIRVYDAGGRQVVRLVHDARVAGRYRVIWDGTDDDGRWVAAGVYFVRIEAGSFTAVRRLVRLR